LTFRKQSLEEFTAAIASRSPVPGGGAVAAITLAHGAALGAMVVAFSLGKKAFAEHEEVLLAATLEFESMRSEALKLADDDARGFEALAKLFPLAQDDPERTSAMPAAINGAIQPPLQIVELAMKFVTLCESLQGRSSKMLRSDLVIAAQLGAVAADAAAWNVRVNLPTLTEVSPTPDAQELGTKVEAMVAETARIAQAISARCKD
jgi:formiminotetrahydrofolate cyclodeaminase